jgi:hypothetical protein
MREEGRLDREQVSVTRLQAFAPSRPRAGTRFNAAITRLKYPNAATVIPTKDNETIAGTWASAASGTATANWASTPPQGDLRVFPERAGRAICAESVNHGQVNVRRAVAEPKRHRRVPSLVQQDQPEVGGDRLDGVRRLSAPYTEHHAGQRDR